MNQAELTRFTRPQVEELSSEFEKDMWILFKSIEDEVEKIILKIESKDGITEQELMSEINKVMGE